MSTKGNPYILSNEDRIVLRTYLGQIYKKLIRRLQFRLLTTNFTPRILQFDGIHKFTATITLIASGVFIITTDVWTTSLYKTIRQISVTLFTMQLFYALGKHKTIAI